MTPFPSLRLLLPRAGRAACALLLLFATTSFAMNHIWEGHYTSGSAIFAYDGDHLWRGHYTSGSAIASWDSRDEIPDGAAAGYWFFKVKVEMK